MADPSEVQAIWQRAITTFPDFKGRWGDAVPQDPRILNAALNDYRNLLTKGGRRTLLFCHCGYRTVS